MFDPSENKALDEWFQRFNAPLKRLPAEERAELRQEVRHHLESLVAANEELGTSPQEAWELALTQFGDPTRIGRRLASEWRHGRSRISPDMAAVLYTLMAQIVSLPILLFCTVLVMALFHLRNYTSGNVITVEQFIGVPIFAGAATGRRFPNRALTGPLYAVAAWFVLATIYWTVDRSSLNARTLALSAGLIGLTSSVASQRLPHQHDQARLVSPLFGRLQANSAAREEHACGSTFALAVKGHKNENGRRTAVRLPFCCSSVSDPRRSTHPACRPSLPRQLPATLLISGSVR